MPAEARTGGRPAARPALACCQPSYCRHGQRVSRCPGAKRPQSTAHAPRVRCKTTVHSNGDPARNTQANAATACSQQGLTSPCSGEESTGEALGSPLRDLIAPAEGAGDAGKGTRSSRAELPLPRPYSARGLLDCRTCTHCHISLLQGTDSAACRWGLAVHRSENWRGLTWPLKTSRKSADTLLRSSMQVLASAAVMSDCTWISSSSLWCSQASLAPRLTMRCNSASAGASADELAAPTLARSSAGLHGQAHQPAITGGGPEQSPAEARHTPGGLLGQGGGQRAARQGPAAGQRADLDGACAAARGAQGLDVLQPDVEVQVATAAGPGCQAAHQLVVQQLAVAIDLRRHSSPRPGPQLAGGVLARAFRGRTRTVSDDLNQRLLRVSRSLTSAMVSWPRTTALSMAGRSSSPAHPHSLHPGLGSLPWPVPATGRTWRDALQEQGDAVLLARLCQAQAVHVRCGGLDSQSHACRLKDERAGRAGRIKPAGRQIAVLRASSASAKRLHRARGWQPVSARAALPAGKHSQVLSRVLFAAAACQLDYLRRHISQSVHLTASFVGERREPALRRQSCRSAACAMCSW